MISQEDFAFIKDYDLAGPERRDQLIQALGPLCAKTLVRLMGRIAKEMTVRYILTLVDDMLKVGAWRGVIVKWFEGEVHQISSWF